MKQLPSPSISYYLFAPFPIIPELLKQTRINKLKRCCFPTARGCFHDVANVQSGRADVVGAPGGFPTPAELLVTNSPLPQRPEDVYEASTKAKGPELKAVPRLPFVDLQLGQAGDLLAVRKTRTIMCTHVLQK